MGPSWDGGRGRGCARDSPAAVRIVGRAKQSPLGSQHVHLVLVCPRWTQGLSRVALAPGGLQRSQSDTYLYHHQVSAESETDLTAHSFPPHTRVYLPATVCQALF